MFFKVLYLLRTYIRIYTSRAFHFLNVIISMVQGQIDEIPFHITLL
jgi:hypothetical protein